MRLRWAALAIVAMTLAASAVACGGDDDDGESAATATRPAAATQTSPAGSPTTAAGATTAAGTPTTAAGGGTTVTIAAQDFSFAPNEFTATIGQSITVSLENKGSAPHTLTVYEDETYTQAVAGATTDRVAGGASDQFVVTFDEPKDYYFRCEVHPAAMKGEVKVQ